MFENVITNLRHPTDMSFTRYKSDLNIRSQWENELDFFFAQKTKPTSQFA